MSPPNVDNMFTLKVDNVPFDIGSDELREVFSKFGEIGDVYIPRARGTNESRGFAFVRFMQKRDAEDAIEGMEGKDFQGRDLRVQFAKQRRPDNPREFYSRAGDERDERGGGFEERGYDDRRGGGGGGYDDRRGGGGGGFDDRRGGGDDRYGGGGSSRERRDDYRRSRSPARHERSRRHSRSRSPRRDHRSSGRERSRSRHRSRSPPRRD